MKVMPMEHHVLWAVIMLGTASSHAAGGDSRGDRLIAKSGVHLNPHVLQGQETNEAPQQVDWTVDQVMAEAQASSTRRNGAQLDWTDKKL